MKLVDGIIQPVYPPDVIALDIALEFFYLRLLPQIKWFHT
jgi:hypothetical protein